MSRKKLSTTVYLDADQVDKLKQLHLLTKVPVAEYIRQGVDLILAQHKTQMPGQTELFVTPIGTETSVGTETKKCQCIKLCSCKGSRP